MRYLLVIAIAIAGCSVRIEHTPESKSECKEKKETPPVIVKNRIFT